MAANTEPIFTSVGVVEGGVTLLTAAADHNGQSINNAVAFISDLTNGSYVHKLRCKANSATNNAATVLRIYINNGKGRLASPIAAVSGTPTGTPSTTGGNLKEGTYFAKVVPDDGYGSHPAASTETASVAIGAGVTTGSIVWNWNTVAGAVAYDIFVGPVTGGQVTKFESSTNSFTQTEMVNVNDRQSLNGYLFNNYLFDEISLPATTASTTLATPTIEIPMNIILPPKYRILVGLGATVAGGWTISTVAGSY